MECKEKLNGSGYDKLRKKNTIVLAGRDAPSASGDVPSMPGGIGEYD